MNNTTEHTSPATAPAALLRVGITQGDTNGVGLEVILKTFAEPTMLELCTPVLFAAEAAVTRHAKALGIEVRPRLVATAAEAQPGQLNLVDCAEGDVQVEFGTPSPLAGRQAFLALESATMALKQGDIDALVTAPICKSTIQSADFRFAGHTEYLAACCGEGAQPLMLLCAGGLRVALVTTHLPLARVAEAITTERVLSQLRALHASLCRDFLISAPRIAVLGLNPHCGDGGTLGSEETEIIAPAIAQAVEAGIPAFGPFAADGFFGSEAVGRFDAVLAMYHDQGLAAFKALAMEQGVNFTAGLPYVRTSPDHGTAFDIAGRGEADPASFRAAVYAAVDIFRNRRASDEATASPLPKLYRERREDGERRPRPAAAPRAEGSRYEGATHRQEAQPAAENTVSTAPDGATQSE